MDEENRSVQKRHSMVSESCDMLEPTLNPNHSHFILVDDGSEGRFGKEIEFRSKLEAELRKGKFILHYKEIHGQSKNESFEESNQESPEKVPMVLICVQGGFYSLETIVISIEKNIPVLILAKSKGCSDLISSVMNLKHPK